MVNIIYLNLKLRYIEIKMENDSDTFEIIAKHAVWIGRVSDDDPKKSTNKPNAPNTISKPKRKGKKT
jgi:hypothetical protein